VLGVVGTEVTLQTAESVLASESERVRSHFGGMTTPPVPHADFDMYINMSLGIGYAF
jgi:hypothetical protein